MHGTKDCPLETPQSTARAESFSCPWGLGACIGGSAPLSLQRQPCSQLPAKQYD